MSDADLFHSLHDDFLLLANCWDGGSARIAAAAGAQALATSSAAVAWSHGYADGYHLPNDLLLATARGIRRVSKLPLSVDIENGYSNDPVKVATLVRALLAEGVVGINIEDGNDTPELLGHKVAAVRAAADAAGVRLYINVRTDVYLRNLAENAGRVAETIRRGEIYRHAGASGLFVPGVRDEADIAAIVAGVPLPINVMALPQVPSPERLRALGVHRLSAGSAISEAALGVVRDAVATFLATGRVDAASPGYGTINALMATGA